jgi:hypothetical protein
LPVQEARQHPPSARHWPPFAQAVQVPPQSSDSPQCLPVQFRVQWQVPSTHVPPSQGVAQQLSKQRPLEQK